MPRLLPTHPKAYTSIQYPFADQLKKFAQELRIGGLFHAVNRLRQMNHLRVGRLVGEDTNGNKYYENTNVAYGTRARSQPLHSRARAARGPMRPRAPTPTRRASTRRVARSIFACARRSVSLGRA